jgi:hypothetical protein
LAALTKTVKDDTKQTEALMALGQEMSSNGNNYTKALEKLSAAD